MGDPWGTCIRSTGRVGILLKRRVEASDAVWALLVGSKLAGQTLSDVPDQTALLADQYPDLTHVQRMNQRLDRAGQLLRAAEREVCTIALNFAFGLHEDFVKSCIRLLVTLGKALQQSSRDAGQLIGAMAW